MRGFASFYIGFSNTLSGDGVCHSFPRDAAAPYCVLCYAVLEGREARRRRRQPDLNSVP